MKQNLQIHTIKVISRSELKVFIDTFILGHPVHIKNP